MDDAPHSTLADRTIWVRFLYMLFCAVAWSIAEFLLVVVALFQFMCVLVNGSVHERTLRFGRNLTAYLEALARFVSFNDEQVPFPFSDWPDAAVGDTPWRAGPAGPVSPPPETGAAGTTGIDETTATDPDPDPEPEPEPEPPTTDPEAPRAERDDDEAPPRGPA